MYRTFINWFSLLLDIGLLTAATFGVYVIAGGYIAFLSLALYLVTQYIEYKNQLEEESFYYIVEFDDGETERPEDKERGEMD